MRPKKYDSVRMRERRAKYEPLLRRYAHLSLAQAAKKMNLTRARVQQLYKEYQIERTNSWPTN